MSPWVVIGLSALAILWLGLFAYLAAKNGFVGIEKTPKETAAMIARVKERQARYDRWRKGL